MPSDGEGRRPGACGTPGASPAPRAARSDQLPPVDAGPDSTLTSAPATAPSASGTRGDRRDVGRRPGRRRRRRGDRHRDGRDERLADARPSARGAGGWRRHRAASASRRLGWSTSWASASTVSSAGDEQRQAGEQRRAAWCPPTRRAARARPSAPRSTSRASRAAGQRSRPAQAAREHGQRGRSPRTGSRTHGRSRGSSIASCRRRTMTVRRSCSVAAKRSWPTRCDRRSAASRDVRPSRATPDHHEHRRRRSGTRPERRPLEGPQRQLAEGRGRAARDDVQRRRRRPAPTSTTPSTVAIQRAQPDARLATSAVPAPSATSVAPGERAGARPTPASRPRCGGDAIWPAIAPATIPTKARNRSCRMAGPRSAVVRSTGASSTWRTSARSSASGPPWLPDRRPTATHERPRPRRSTPARAGAASVDLARRSAGCHRSTLEPTTTTTTPTMPVRYAWYRTSIQWTSSVRA